MPWLDDLAAQLNADGVGAVNVNIFLTTNASIPILVSGEATLQIIETGGTSPSRTQNATIFPAYLHPGAQLTARGRTYAIAREMADAAYQSLCKVRNQFIASGVNWHRKISMLSEPQDIAGLDERKQPRVSFNVLGDYNRRD